MSLSKNATQMTELEKAAENADPDAFARVASAIDWSRQSPTEFIRALDLALALDMVPLARELAQQGSRVFPDDLRLQQAAAVLSPPVVVNMRPARGPSLEASQQWLKEHASQYKGQWVAVRHGTLLGSAPTVQKLHEQIRANARMTPTVIVKVLS